MIDRMGSRILTLGSLDPAKAGDLARVWATRTAAALRDAQGSRFRSEHDIAAGILRDILSSQGAKLSDEESLREIREAWLAFVRVASLWPDVTESLWERVRESADGVALVSDIDEEAAEDLLERLRLRPQFDVVILSEAERAYKPNPVLYRHAAESLRVSSADCLFVSDSTVDLVGAKKAGMGAALVRRELPMEPSRPLAGTLVLDTLDPVPTVLRRYRETRRFRL